MGSKCASAVPASVRRAKVGARAVCVGQLTSRGDKSRTRRGLESVDGGRWPGPAARRLQGTAGSAQVPAPGQLGCAGGRSGVSR